MSSFKLLFSKYRISQRLRNAIFFKRANIGAKLYGVALIITGFALGVACGMWLESRKAQKISRFANCQPYQQKDHNDFVRVAVSTTPEFKITRLNCDFKTAKNAPVLAANTTFTSATHSKKRANSNFTTERSRQLKRKICLINWARVAHAAKCQRICIKLHNIAKLAPCLFVFLKIHHAPTRHNVKLIGRFLARFTRV